MRGRRRRLQPKRAGQFLNGEEAAAAGELAALRNEFPRLTLYPFLVQLADFSYAAGDLDGAEAAYAEVLEDPRSRPLARESVVRNRAQLRMREGEQASAGVGATSGDEGTLVTSQARIRKGLGEHWYLGGEFTRQDIDLDGPGASSVETSAWRGGYLPSAASSAGATQRQGSVVPMLA